MNRWTIRQNIVRFTERLKGPLDDAERRKVEQLLAEEKQKLRDMDRTDHG